MNLIKRPFTMMPPLALSISTEPSNQPCTLSRSSSEPRLSRSPSPAGRTTIAFNCKPLSEAGRLISRRAKMRPIRPKPYSTTSVADTSAPFAKSLAFLPALTACPKSTVVLIAVMSLARARVSATSRPALACFAKMSDTDRATRSPKNRTFAF